MVEIWAIGGYEEVGKMMTAVRFENDKKWVILDCGVNMDRLISLEERCKNPMKLDEDTLYNEKVLPDDREFFKRYGKDVSAIVISHGHLDHVLATVKLASKYKNAMVIATHFTMEVLKNNEEFGRVNNRKVILYPGVRYRVSEKTEVELVNVTHSIPQSSMICLSNDEGNLLYSVDFKFDDFPIIGKKTDYKKIREIGRDLKILFTDSTRTNRDGKCYSEIVVKYMLYDILKWYGSEKNLIVVSTFSSHIARLKTIVEIAEEIGRVPVFLGRSLHNYLSAALNSNVSNIMEKYKVCGTPKEIKDALKMVNAKRDEFLLVVTGHQGERNSVLRKIAFGKVKFNLEEGDVVILGSEPIPSPSNIANRMMLEKRLREIGVRLFRNVHVSGHAYSEDLRSLFRMCNPENYIPCHGDITMISSSINAVESLGYKIGENVFLLHDNKRIKI